MGNRSLTGWFGLGLLLALPPLLVVTIPPLVDYPNHLARIAILHTLPAGSFAAEHYRVDTWLVPNLLFDGVMYVLVAVLPLETAGVSSWRSRSRSWSGARSSCTGPCTAAPPAGRS